MNGISKLFAWAEKETQPTLSFLNIGFNNTSVISGKKNSGKSHFANEIVKNCNRYVLWDSRYERVNKITSFTSVKAIPITEKDIKITSDVNDIMKYNKIIFHPYAKTKKEMGALFDMLCKRVYHAKNYMLIIEEADSIADRWHPLTSGLFELVQGNIHVNCGLVFIVRRLQNLNPDIVRLSDNLFIFKYSSKDKEYLESFLGISELPEEIPNRAFFHYDGAELKYYEKGIGD